MQKVSALKLWFKAIERPQEPHKETYNLENSLNNAKSTLTTNISVVRFTEIENLCDELSAHHDIRRFQIKMTDFIIGKVSKSMDHVQ